MKFSHRMTGYDELLQTFRRMSETVQRDVSVDALKDAAEPMRAEAAALAPRSKGAGPHMADHIVVAETGFGISDGPDVSTVAVGPTKEFFYAEFQERGTAHHPAHPFMRPAFDTQQGAVKKRLADAFRRALHAAIGVVR